MADQNEVKTTANEPNSAQDANRHSSGAKGGETRGKRNEPPPDQTQTEGGTPDFAGTGYEPDDVSASDSIVTGEK